MDELKTKPTNKSPLQVIAAIPSENKQADAKKLLEIFGRVTGQPPIVWGEKLIGYGLYTYQRKDGHSYEIYATGFSVRKDKITLHLYLDEPGLQDYLTRLGKCSAGKSCLYFNKLNDVDVIVLEEMLRTAWHLEVNALHLTTD